MESIQTYFFSSFYCKMYPGKAGKSNDDMNGSSKMLYKIITKLSLRTRYSHQKFKLFFNTIVQILTMGVCVTKIWFSHKEKTRIFWRCKIFKTSDSQSKFIELTITVI